ncbi:PREDICTED: galactose-3-O-sulfotransferase 3-like [Branchiostoma belcheri]|uniref:Galactose-3-O-sulfotransferase 3-like n=1 Tax=Branchiostoma belcheri TaxID=7741 RepID=A0A6P4YUP1_BRABE|nr:PREDICTED: galactose-3-O-sulfotransferase 3-like [Branchiostoma belcheri]
MNNNSISNSQGTCQPHLNVAFMKIHKCGSSLISQMLLRFGYEHNLIVALPSRPGYSIIGGVGGIKDGDYVHPPGGKRWNIFVHHAFYNRTRFRQLMAPDTRYVAILREPLDRLKSAFQYFHLEKTFPGLKQKTRRRNAYVTTYLSRPSYWDPLYRDKTSFHACARNCMSRDLGLAERHYDNRTAVQEFVRGIENDFQTVLILEHLPASLVLLKRRMCWTFRDILYTSAGNARVQKYRRKARITDTMKRAFYQHNYADALLYNRFKESLQKQIRQEGPDFQEEVNHFTRVNHDVDSYCRSAKRQQGGNLVVEKSRWNEAFSLNKLFCARYAQVRRYWEKLLRSRYGLPRKKSSRKSRRKRRRSKAMSSYMSKT